MTQDTARRQRAAARTERTVLHKARLSTVEADLSPLRGAAAISLLTQLTRESWSLAGLESPSYERHRIPIRFVPRSIK